MEMTLRQARAVKEAYHLIRKLYWKSEYRDYLKEQGKEIDWAEVSRMGVEAELVILKHTNREFFDKVIVHKLDEEKNE